MKKFTFFSALAILMLVLVACSNAYDSCISGATAAASVSVTADTVQAKTSAVSQLEQIFVTIPPGQAGYIELWDFAGANTLAVRTGTLKDKIYVSNITPTAGVASTNVTISRNYLHVLSSTVRNGMYFASGIAVNPIGVTPSAVTVQWYKP